MLSFDPLQKTYFEKARIPSKDRTDVYYRFRQIPNIPDRPYDLLIVFKSQEISADYAYDRELLWALLTRLKSYLPANIHRSGGYFHICAGSGNSPYGVDILEAKIPDELVWMTVIDEAMDLLVAQ